VNTLMLKRDNRLLGDNTDGAGLVHDLRDNLSVELGNRRVLIVGAGGATRGVVAPLLVLRPAQLVVANRTADRAEAFAADFADLGAVRGCGFDEIGFEAFDLVINATSASLSGEVPAIPESIIQPTTVCYDMAYGRAETPFLKWARERGCARVLQGWGMLVEQAAESFQLWRGVRPQTRTVLEALRQRAALSAS
jgi:shikimate dehydrogenase